MALFSGIREAALYRATAGVGFRFLIEQVGDVYGIYPRKDPLARKFVGRYTTGTSINWRALPRSVFHRSGCLRLWAM